MVLQTARKVVVLVIGGTVVLAGAVMLVTPGPGIAGILGGLAILATEFVWARLLLKRLKQRATDMLSGERPRQAGHPDGTTPPDEPPGTRMGCGAGPGAPGA